ncbi:hypothetical protein NXC14_PA00270 (plasmid) [Rhizobium sp. NXC14]|nr:hypothetical protein NXC14_PA00270 [Rhizobium sp. NXC14]
MLRSPRLSGYIDAGLRASAHQCRAQPEQQPDSLQFGCRRRFCNLTHRSQPNIACHLSKGSFDRLIGNERAQRLVISKPPFDVSRNLFQSRQLQRRTRAMINELLYPRLTRGSIERHLELCTPSPYMPRGGHRKIAWLEELTPSKAIQPLGSDHSANVVCYASMVIDAFRGLPGPGTPPRRVQAKLDRRLRLAQAPPSQNTL